VFKWGGRIVNIHKELSRVLAKIKLRIPLTDEEKATCLIALEIIAELNPADESLKIKTKHP